MTPLSRSSRARSSHEGENGCPDCRDKDRARALRGDCRAPRAFRRHRPRILASAKSCSRSAPSAAIPLFALCRPSRENRALPRAPRRRCSGLRSRRAGRDRDGARRRRRQSFRAGKGPERNPSAKQAGIDGRKVERGDFVAFVHDRTIGVRVFGGRKPPKPGGRRDAARRSAPSQEQSERRKYSAAVNTTRHSLDIQFSSQLAAGSRERSNFVLQKATSDTLRWASHEPA